jgi:dTDP-4-dehydrorhamnose reductase
MESAMSAAILLTGASGLLGSYLLCLLVERGLPVVAWSGSRAGELFGVPLHPVDLTDSAALTAAFQTVRPALVFHTAALARVADCHRDPERARQVNAGASAELARLCAASGARLVHVSTDLVFDGEHAPYREEDPVAPLSVYGRTKAEAEQAVQAMPGNVVVRVSLLLGPSLVGKTGFFEEQVTALRGGRKVPLFEDEWRTPLDLASAAEGLLAIGQSEVGGLLHLGGWERWSRLEIGRQLAGLLGLAEEGIVAVRREFAPAAEPRPPDVSLDSSRFRGLFPGVADLPLSAALARLLAKWSVVRSP